MNTLTIPVPAVDKAVRFLKIDVPVRYDEEDMPNDFPGRIDDVWSCFVDLLTGEWGLSMVDGSLTMSPVVKHSLYMKVCDEGTYTILTSTGEAIRAVVEDYVPGFFPGDHYGDYLIFEMDGGKITNWNISEFKWDEYWEPQ